MAGRVAVGVRFLKTDGEEHVFSIAEGRANIDGFKVERSQSQRLSLPIDPDLQRVSSEPQIFNDAGKGAMVVTLNCTPLASALDVQATKQKTETLIHGAFTGARDVLTEPTIVAVIAIKQGTTTFTQGAEPAPGSSYQVTYHYIASIVTPSRQAFPPRAWRWPRSPTIGAAARNPPCAPSPFARSGSRNSPPCSAKLPTFTI